MTIKKAHTEAKKLWGKNACVEDTKKPSSPEMRSVAKAKWETYDTALKIAVAHGPWRKALQANRSDEAWRTQQYRYKVGRVVMGMFFEVKGQGDTWEEAFANAK